MPENEAKWYVVHTYSGYENKVKSTLETTVENRGMKDLIQEERKIFPGYVIVKMVMNDDSWYVVRNIRGCTGFVGPSSKPVPLSDEEVERLGVETKSVEVNYEVGDSVRITDSPFEDSIGIVDNIDLQNNSVRVIIHMFGRETPVELELSQVEPLE